MHTVTCGSGSSVGIATGYGLDGPGIESRWGEIFRTCLDRPWGPPSSLYNGYRVFPGVKSGRSVRLTPHPLLVPWSWMSRATRLLPLWVVRPVQGLSTYTRMHFTFTYLYSYHNELKSYKCPTQHYQRTLSHNVIRTHTGTCSKLRLSKRIQAQNRWAHF